MNRERVGRYIKRTSLGIAALSVVAMAIDNVATNTAAASVYPETISFAEKESASKTVSEAENALERLSVFIPEEIRSSLRMTVESSTQVVTAKKTIYDYTQWSADRTNYAAELRGSRDLWEAAGVIGGITLAAIGNVVAQGRRMWVTATSRG